MVMDEQERALFRQAMRGVRRLKVNRQAVPRPRPKPRAHFARADRRAALWQCICDLRAAGERVIGALADDEAPPASCDRELTWQKNAWRVLTIKRRRGVGNGQ